MSQVWSADARFEELTTALPDGTMTAVISTEALPCPQETAKASVIATATVAIGALQTSLVAALVRNPDSENVPIAGALMEFDAGTQTFAVITVGGTDEIPSPRDVIYQLQLEAIGDAGQAAEAFIQTMLLSG